MLSEVFKRILKRKGVIVFIIVLSIIGIIMIFNKKERGSAFDFPPMEEPLYKPNNFNKN